MRDRLRIAAGGAVQGVGFRPFLYRLAEELGLGGWCQNTPHGVYIEVEGDRGAVEQFRMRLERDLPPRAAIHTLETSWLDPAGFTRFEIRTSALDGRITAEVMPDLAMCADCRRELLDPHDRRFHYPFINCTNCGPRFSIIERLPYDRARTSMRRFRMCDACQREYDDPATRRFHAEPNACPACGPRLALWSADGEETAVRGEALELAVAALTAGRIVAVKGLGGFHLMVDAQNEGAVTRLRARKHREEKPFALMYPDAAAAARDARLSADEVRLLTSAESPIVLVDRREDACAVARSVAPASRTLGVMLPYTPLHLLLLRGVGGPVVATSGNRTDEPICTREEEAVERLHAIADVFLVHDRPIVRHVDDSIVRLIAGREMVLRRARGFVPMPMRLSAAAPPVVGVGAHLKNTVAITTGAGLVVSQHIGDLESEQASAAFREVLGSLEALYAVRPGAVVVDQHLDYLSTRYGNALGLPVTAVQHHYAHVAACMLENDLEGTALGVSWDGSGFGPDGTVWGGEFLAVTGRGWSRLACLRPFRLPGGERAVREPRRSAIGLAWAVGGADQVGDLRPGGGFQTSEVDLLVQMIGRGVNAPVTTSAGRFFDAVASFVGLRHTSSFEGQAAMELEAAVSRGVNDSYPFEIGPPTDAQRLGTWQPPRFVVDWALLVRAVLDDVRIGAPVGTVAARFHNTLAEVIVAVAEIAAEPRVVLTGGCFQNRYLTERTIARLREVGFRPYWHQRLPPNDGGISAGQVAAFLRARATSEEAVPCASQSQAV